MGLEEAVALEKALVAWRGDLLLTPTGQPKALIENALVALRQAPEWAGVLAYDGFSMATVAVKPPPWRKGEGNSWEQQRWTDVDDSLACAWLNREGIGITVPVTSKAVEAAARGRTFHPVRDFLNGLTWDGCERVADFASKKLGAEISEYTSEVSRRFFIAGVARIMQPGAKHDHMPILEGAQDRGKSTAVELLFKPWFTDDIAELGSKDASMQMAGVWGVEVAELASMTRGEIEKVKAFVSRKIDRFRPSYGRHVIEAPRQCVFVGTTNSDDYLKDETGGRRFWPIRCGKIDLKAIEAEKHQLWAEAVDLYQAGEPWWLTTDKARLAAIDEQATRYSADPWYDSIAKHAAGITETNVGEILESVLGIEKGRWTRADQMRVGGCLKAQGWRRCQVRNGSERSWVYRKDLVGDQGW